MTILRTQRDGCWTLQTNQWGTFLAPTVDPDADTFITQEQLEGFELHPDVPHIPADLWLSGSTFALNFASVARVTSKSPADY